MISDFRIAIFDWKEGHTGATASLSAVNLAVDRVAALDGDEAGFADQAGDRGRSFPGACRGRRAW